MSPSAVPKTAKLQNFVQILALFVKTCCLNLLLITMINIAKKSVCYISYNIR